jgi:hypothetical protein
MSDNTIANGSNLQNTEDPTQRLIYFPIAKNLSYNEANDASTDLPASVFGKYVKPPRQPQIILSEFFDPRGYDRPRTHDGDLISVLDLSRRCFAVYFPAPMYIQMQPLLSFLDATLNRFVGYRDIILQYQSTNNQKLYLEYSTTNQLIQCDLHMFFGSDYLRYCGCKMGQGTDWWC